MACLAEAVKAEFAARPSQETKEPSCLRALLDVIPHQVWTAGPDGSADFIGVQWLQFCGVDAQQLSGDNWLHFVHPDDRKACARKWTQSISQEIPFEHRFRLLRSDGDYRWFHCQALPLRNEQGDILKWVATNTNIQSQVESEEKLFQKRRGERALTHLMTSLLEPELDKEKVIEKFRAIALVLTESAHAYISEIDPANHGNVVQPMTKPLKGMKYAGAVLRPIRSSDDPTYPHLWGHSLNTGNGFYTNAPKEHPAWSGILPAGHIPIKNFLSVPAIASGTTYGQIAVANSERGYSEEDLKLIKRLASLYALCLERIRRREELENSRRQLHSIYQALPEPTLVWKAVEGNFLLEDYNRAAVEMTEGEIAKLKGKLAREILADAHHLHEDLKKGFAERASHEGVRIAALPGTGEHLELMVKYAYIAPDMILMHAEDISLRVALEKSLRKARDEAEAASRSKSEFLAIMSHELRTPLNGMMGMMQLLEMSPLDPEQQEFASTALCSGKSLLALIEDILDYSKIEAGKMDLRSESFELQKMLHSVFEIFSQPAFQQGLNLDYSIDSALPRMLTGDPVRLRQVLFNLVGNAIKFTPKGQVRIRVSGAASAANPGHVRLKISVADTGIGIPADKLDYIFEPFTQVDCSFNRKYEGPGLGLGIVKRLVNLMSGQLHVESACGSGTTVSFSLELPIVGDTPAVLPPSSSRHKSTGRRILLAEDNAVNRFTAMVLLKKLGYQAHAVATGEEAVQELRQNPYDLVLMDIQMPGMDGLEAARLIRRNPQGKTSRDVPVVAVTAHAKRGDRENSLAAGMDDYIVKPFEFKDLKETIERFLG